MVSSRFVISLLLGIMIGTVIYFALFKGVVNTPQRIDLLEKKVEALENKLR